MKFIDKLLGLGGKDPEVIDEPVPEGPGIKRRWTGEGRLPLTEKQWRTPITTTDEQAAELADIESFTDLINARFDLDGQFVLMNDMNTVGAVFELTPVVTDARSPEYMQDVLNNITGILKDSIPRDAQSPWLLQITMQDEGSMKHFKEKLSSYPVAEAHDKPFTREWIRVLHEHMDDVADPNGLFVDKMVSGGIWYARFRKIRVFLWRTKPQAKRDFGTPIGEVIDQMIGRFKAAGITIEQKPTSELYEWLSRFFVPAGKDYIGMDINDYLDLHPYHNDERLRVLSMLEDSGAGDLVRSSLQGTRPYSDDSGNWYFCGKPTRFITIQEATQEPKIGHISAELQSGDHRYALWDQMPPGAIWSQTIIFEAEDVITEDLDKLEGNVIGDDEKSKQIKENIQQARVEIARGNCIFKSFMGVYTQADTPKELERVSRNVSVLLDSKNLKTIPVNMDLIAQDCFIRGLPFNFDPDHDKRISLRRARKYFVGHLARLVPFYGRGRGTGNPACLFFNRGGEPFTFDPLKDRVKNAFALILGPAGSGKSALLNFLIAQYVAFYDARFFIIEKGKSFYLLGKFLQTFGVQVNQVTVTPDKPVSLNPFNDACRLPEVTSDGQINEFEFDTKHDMLAEEEAEDDNLEDSQRDELGEMVLAAITMITGGEEKELNLLRRHERFDIMQAIIDAGKRTIERGYTLPEDISESLKKMSEDHDGYSAERRARLREFSDNMQFFCTGVRGAFFNRPGEAWPDADVTIFDIGMMTSDQYSDMLGVSMVSMLNKVISIAEANQYNNRPIIALADEGHITTTNPLIAPIVTNMTKMARKLGLWFWLATQNLSDFKDASRKMLSNMEWWITMSTTRDEVDQISRFKDLTKEQELLLLAARKEPGKYTEGVVMSDRVLSLFRNVPPALAMALAQTEGHEKVERKRLMDKHGISELEAAYMIADEMRKQRKAG
jgi:conjugative transfer ATPase